MRPPAHDASPDAMRGEHAIILARSVGACVLFLSVFAVSSCARPSDAMHVESLRGRGAVVEVRNDQFDDLIVYLIRGGTPIPLGVVPGLTRRTLGVREGLLSNGREVALGASKRGGPIRYITAPFDLPPGRSALWVLRAGEMNEQPVVGR